SNIEVQVAADSSDSALRALVRRLRPAQGTVDGFPEPPWSEPCALFAFPTRKGLDAPLPELSAIFAIAFYLSDLVRYHPNVIAGDSETTDPWLLDTFRPAGPGKFARLGVSLVLV